MKDKKKISQNQQFMVYGLNGCTSILDSHRCLIKKILISKFLRDSNSDLLLLLSKHKNVVVLSDQDFKNDFYMYRTQGIVIYFEYSTLNNIPLNLDSSNECYLILDSVKDPQNLGQIIRTSECAGVTGIILPNRKSVGITNSVLQVSQGAFCNIDIIQTNNIKYAINDLKEMNFWVVGIENSIESKLWYEIDMKGRIAFVMGSEGEGIRPIIKKYCDYFGTIPMLGKTNSLNVAATVSAILFEWRRQTSKD